MACIAVRSPDICLAVPLVLTLDSGLVAGLGAKLVNVSMVAMVREIFKLKNVRRAADSPGLLNRFDVDLAGTPAPVYVTAQC